MYTYVPPYVPLSPSVLSVPARSVPLILHRLYSKFDDLQSETLLREMSNKGEGRGGKEMMLSCVNKAYCLVSVVRHRFEYS